MHEIRIHGRGGQGAVLASAVVVRPPVEARRSIGKAVHARDLRRKE